MIITRMRLIAVAALCLAAVAACSPDREPLPEGIQTMTGVLRSTELSRTRRGTHVLEAEGEVQYYVESPRINLRPYLGTDVTVRGTLEKNTDRKSLPVLVVESVIAKNAVLRPWKVPALSLTLSAPDQWLGTTSSNGISFGLSGETAPIMTVRLTTLATLPEGTPILVANLQGRRVRDAETGAQDVYIQRGQSILRFSLTPPDDAGKEPYIAEHFDALIKSVAFQSQSSVPSSGSGSKTGSGQVKSGAYCGGAAGLLCPQGQYCEVTDRENDIGTCRPLR